MVITVSGAFQYKLSGAVDLLNGDIRSYFEKVRQYARKCTAQTECAAASYINDICQLLTDDEQTEDAPGTINIGE